jgi:hypothetical protein
MRGQSFLSGAALSHRASVGGGAFLGDPKLSCLDVWWGVDRPGTYVIESYMEKLAFTRARLFYVRVIMVIMCVSLIESLCQTAMERIAALEYMLSGCMGSCGQVLSCQETNVAISWGSGAGGAYLVVKTPRWGNWMLGPIPGQGGRWNGQIGGEILPIHVYHNEEKRMCGLLPGSVLLRLVVLPLQAGVVGSCPIRGIWFSSHLSLKRNNHIQNLGV